MIYLVTTVYFNTDKPNDLETRTWCYFNNVYEAIEFVHNNQTDLNESGYWPFAVIEELKEKSMICEKEVWFQFDEDFQKYLEIVKPIQLEGIINFGLS